MNRIRSVVLDTSTLVSAALRTGSIPHQAFLKALCSCRLCASPETLAELVEVLDREKFDRYLSLDARKEFVGLILENVRVFAVQKARVDALQSSCRDPKDIKFLALALVAEADALISSDQDLLVLHPWREISILSPSEFLDAPSLRS